MDFETAFRLLIGHEGGYVNDPVDRGGETKFGISRRAYPDLDIRGLSLDDARAIYRRDYWDRLRLDEMPVPVRMAAFDFAVNSGVAAAARALQSIAGVPADGIVGPLTVAGVRRIDPAAIRFGLAAHRALIMLRLIARDRSQARFAAGWANRLETEMDRR